METQKIVRICEFPVLSTTKDKLAAQLLDAIQQRKQVAVFFANTNLIVKCRAILERLKDPGVLLVNDGIGMDIAARLFGGKRFDENLNGTDFTPFLCRRSREPLKIFMVGGKPDVLARAVTHARQELGQDVVGSCDGYGGLTGSTDLVQRINDSGAQLVLVAMGNPIQENWILDHGPALSTNVLMGVGALFDFWAGDKPRAPKLFQQMRLEWLYRLSLEPRRLLRRYTWDILVFLRLCYKYR